MIFLLATLFLPFAHAENIYQAQYHRSIEGLLANVFPNGALVASPSQRNPNYYFDWVRDTSLTMKTVVQLSEDGRLPSALRSALKERIENWVQWELRRQEVPKMTDLGEPRFYVNGWPNHEPWARPQNDGPALRALAAIETAHSWIAQGRFDDVEKYLYRSELPARTLIKRDLEYLAHHWMETSYDLWEEERALHFYTLTMQKAALDQGKQLARIMGDEDAASYYQRASLAIENLLGYFIDPARGTIRYAIEKQVSLPHKRSDLDVSVLLAAIQSYDGKFHVPVPETIRTVNKLIARFQEIYPINRLKMGRDGSNLGAALGRYEDDLYNGLDSSDASAPAEGNPWFISTLAVAEFSCDLNQNPELAAAQFNRVFHHLPHDGSMSEQISRRSGMLQGARDLTWSYVSYITAYRACFQNSAEPSLMIFNSPISWSRRFK